MSLVCPTCGGQMQASTRLYLVISADGALDVQSLNADEVSYYCENDHPAAADLVAALDAVTSAQWVQLRDRLERGF